MEAVGVRGGGALELAVSALTESLSTLFLNVMIIYVLKGLLV
jgi:hypothetical protein